MSYSLLIGVLGTLGGVGLGAWLTGRQQRELLRENHRHLVVQERAAAYIEFLASYRQFRRFIQTESTVGVKGGLSASSVPVIEGADSYWNMAEQARVQMELLTIDSRIREAGYKVMNAFQSVALARTQYAADDIPSEIIDAARGAEHEFLHLAREDISRNNKFTRTSS